MTTPEFRNPDKFQRLAFRDYLRKHMPSSSDGYVVEDLDLAIRVYQPSAKARFNFQTDDDGKFRLIELKYKNAWITNGQRRLFGLMDRQGASGDPSGKRYLGYFIVQYSAEDWERSSFRINGKPIDRETFHRFLMFEDIGINGFFDSEDA